MCHTSKLTSFVRCSCYLRFSSNEDWVLQCSLWLPYVDAKSKAATVVVDLNEELNVVEGEMVLNVVEMKWCYWCCIGSEIKYCWKRSNVISAVQWSDIKFYS